MRLTVNLEKRRHPQWQEVVGIFLRPIAKNFPEDARPSQSYLDGPSQKAIFFSGMNQGLFFNFVYADDLMSAMKSVRALGFKWVYTVNGAYFSDYQDIRQWISRLEEDSSKVMASAQLPVESLGPQDVWVAGVERFFREFDAGKIEVAKNGRIKGVPPESAFAIPRDRLQFTSQFLTIQTAQHNPFVTVFTTGNEVPDAEQCRRFANAKISAVIAPSSGFFVNSLLRTFNDQVSRIAFYDASEQALEYKKRVNETWQPGGKLPPVSATSAEIDDRMVLFNEKIFPSDEAVQQHWQFYRSLPKTYDKVNLIENPDGLVQLVPGDGEPFVWLSNIFTYSMNVQLYTLDDIQYAFLHLLRGIRKKNPRAIVAGRMPSGRYFYDRAPDVYMGLSNFNFF